MKSTNRFPLLLLIIAGFWLPGQAADPSAVNLSSVRKNFHTKLLPQSARKEPVEGAPKEIFQTIKYPATNGLMAAYLTPDPGDGKKHPAIVWITGGDCNSIGDVWSPAPRSNDQTAAAYRQAGVIMMFPSLRGGNANPGVREGFLGEVDDVIAAAKHLQTLSYVDSTRIYLGGHSTGGTLAMLVAECSPLFRAVFAFGPVENVAGYGPGTGWLPIDLKDRQEVMIRSPGFWLGSIQSPTWVLEGTGGNISSLYSMARVSINPKVRFIEVKGANHFAILAPINELIANKIVQDTGAECKITIAVEEANRTFAASQPGKPAKQ